VELFEKQLRKNIEMNAPLADRIRPRTLDECVGQAHLIGEGKIITEILRTKNVPSIIFWGPPGSGKTTLARIIADASGHNFVQFSAVVSGVKEVREIIKEAEGELKYKNRRTILFVDEIHHFNRSQQDAFLPYVEKGIIILIGATTENPSFEINSALLSRCKVLVLASLSKDDIIIILRKAISDKERGLGSIDVSVSDEIIEYIAESSHGDARSALNTLELAVSMAQPDSKGKRTLTLPLVTEVMQKKPLIYDKDREEHYNVISAFIKSMRGSDPDAAVYYLARMLEAGEDPLFIARRMVIFASEDIGNADPQAIQVAVSAMQAFDFVGMPEGWIPLAQCATYLASAPKSNASYLAYLRAKEDVKKHGNIPVPEKLRNPVTELMKGLGYGKDYKYPHDFEGHVIPGEKYLPDKLKSMIYYEPSDSGYEKKIKERLERIKNYKKGGEK
jgi:putative ATPase